MFDKCQLNKTKNRAFLNTVMNYFLLALMTLGFRISIPFHNLCINVLIKDELSKILKLFNDLSLGTY